MNPHLVIALIVILMVVALLYWSSIVAAGAMLAMIAYAVWSIVFGG